MEALNILKSEHSALLGEVYQMDKRLTFLESSGPIKGVRVLKELAETSGRMQENLLQHTAKEEKGFFPVLESRLGKELQDLKGGLSDHLSREERVLFWLAELRLSWRDQRKIASSIQATNETAVHLHVWCYGPRSWAEAKFYTG